jgi:hypothetical protein
MEKPQKRFASVDRLWARNPKIDEAHLEKLKASIVEEKRIIKPIIAEIVEGHGYYIVLSGNHRTIAGQQLLRDPKINDELRANLNSTEILVYRNLTDKERASMLQTISCSLGDDGKFHCHVDNG